MHLPQGHPKKEASPAWRTLMAVEKIFRMAAEGMGPKAIQTRLYREDIPSPTGKRWWPHRIVKNQMILNDLYKPHSYEEIRELVSPEVAEELDPSQSYGVWWHNRRNVTKAHSSERDGNGGKRYKARTSVKTRDKEEWIAVPVPAYLPCGLVNKARLMLEEDQVAVLTSLAEVIPYTLDDLSGEERNRLYRMLRLTVTPLAEGFEASGVFCSLGPTPGGRRGRRGRRGSCGRSQALQLVSVSARA